jgi:hypothetical protein
VKSADQVREDYERAMGPQLGEVFYVLWNELAWLDLKWQQYCQLFAASSKRVELLNASAGLFFRVVQDVLWDDVLLAIARLTGPVRSVGKDNLTLRRLPDLVSDTSLTPLLQAAVDQAVGAAAFAKDWRDRRIAHRDLALVLDRGAQPLAPASRANVRAALATMHNVFDTLHERYFGSRIGWELISSHGDADAVVHRLAAARLTEEKRMKRLHDGKALPDDLEEPDEI